MHLHIRIYVLFSTMRDVLQTLVDDILAQKYPVWDLLALVIVSELTVILPLVRVLKLILSPCFTLSVVLVSFMNLYHCTSSFLMLPFNTQVNTAPSPSDIVTSSG